MEHLDLTIANGRKRTESALCAISGKTCDNKSVLTVFVPKKPAALSVGSINIDAVEDENNYSTYKIHE